MSDLPGNDRLPPGMLAGDESPPERVQAAEDDDFFWSAWWENWVKRRQKEDL